MARDQTDQFLTDLAEARRKKKKRHDSSKTPPGSPPHKPPPTLPPAGPSGTSGSSGASGASGSSEVPTLPPPPPYTNQEGQSHGSTAPSSSKTAASDEYTAWMTSDTRFKPSVSSIPEYLHTDDDSALDNFGDQFFNDKPSKAENEKTTAETEAKSMVSITIQQDTSAIPPMTTPVIDLTSKPDSPKVHRPLLATATTTTTKTTLPPPPQPQQSTTDSILIKRIDKLEQIMANLIQDNKHLEERLDSHRSRLYRLENLNIPQQILHQRMWETNSYQANEDHKNLYEAQKKSMARDQTDQFLTDLAEARRKKKKRHDSSKTPPGSPPHKPPPTLPPAGPSGTSGSSGASGASGSSEVPTLPPPPPYTNQEGQSHGSTTPSSSKTAASDEYTAWMTSDTRFKPSVSSIP
nr:hypothetical protein [Tanacetum cinerariifolium]